MKRESLWCILVLVGAAVAAAGEDHAERWARLIEERESREAEERKARVLQDLDKAEAMRKETKPAWEAIETTEQEGDETKASYYRKKLQPILDGQERMIERLNRTESLEKRYAMDPVDPATLTAAYSTNAIRADLDYKGKRFLIEGNVLALDTTDDGTPGVMLAGGAVCYFDKRWIEDLAKLEKSDLIVVYGLFAGRLGEPRSWHGFVDCELAWPVF